MMLQFIPGSDLDEYGLMKIRDPYDKRFPVAIVGMGETTVQKTPLYLIPVQ
jgi:hypothetical protein